MDKQLIEKKINEMLASSKQRKFDEAIELIITLKNINLKAKEQRVDFSVALPNPYSTKIKTLAFLKDKNLILNVKGIVDRVIADEDISKITKKEGKKIANEYDMFLAEGPVMLTVGKYLGQTLSPRGKMPVVAPPNENAIKALIQSSIGKCKISNTKNKASAAILLKVGKRSQKVSELVDNIFVIYNALIEKLPSGTQNLKDFAIKTTMGSLLKIGDNK
ncbi:MAG: hypothetical protein V1824_04695 [archaeon]